MTTLDKVIQRIGFLVTGKAPHAVETADTIENVSEKTGQGSRFKQLFVKVWTGIL